MQRINEKFSAYYKTKSTFAKQEVFIAQTL